MCNSLFIGHIEQLHSCNFVRTSFQISIVTSMLEWLTGSKLLGCKYRDTFLSYSHGKHRIDPSMSLTCRGDLCFTSVLFLTAYFLYRYTFGAFSCVSLFPLIFWNVLPLNSPKGTLTMLAKGRAVVLPHHFYGNNPR